MSLKRIRKVRFQNTPIYRMREPHAALFLTERTSFWIATLSLIAFVAGNMIGHHGWYVFWRSVIGEGVESQIVYTGTVTPIEKVPDYVKWSAYGGSSEYHTYRQVPANLLVNLPAYNPSSKRLYDGKDIGQVYSVGHAGSYVTEGDNNGSHPGVDIRVPQGTPVRAVSNGVIHEVKTDSGFGKTVVIKHPNVPDPKYPARTTTLYSSYAHLSVTYAKVGEYVQMGDRIALSGQTGFATGPHLHFQMDQEDAPWHPYWPFTTTEARSAGYSTAGAVNNALHQERIHRYTVHPMLYVQADYPVSQTLVASAAAEPIASGRVVRKTQKPSLLSRLTRRTSRAVRSAAIRSRAEERAKVRLSQKRMNRQSVVKIETEDPVVLNTQVVVSASLDDHYAAPVQTVSSVRIHHDGEFAGRAWEKIRITILDQNGVTVTSPADFGEIYLRTAYGEADFKPTILTSKDFTNGEAVVQMLPRGRRTVVVIAEPFRSMSKPMKYER